MSLAEYIKSADMVEEIYREAKMMKNLEHKNIVKLMGAYVVKEEIIMIMEYCEGGELSQLVEDNEGITEMEARRIVKQIINAIEVCHLKGIIHRDLKLENVMFADAQKTILKVVDFGISGRCKGNSAEKNNAGTLLYMAPEVLKGHATFASPA